jgi:hypothetical protein
MSARRFGLAFLVSLCVVATGGAALWSAPAGAATGFVYAGSFGSEGSGEGQLKEPTGVAVDNATGDVYVIDHGNTRIDEFSAAGAFIRSFNGGAAPSGALRNPAAIAVDNSGDPLDPSDGDVYVADSRGYPENTIYKFDEDGTYIGQIVEGKEGGVALYTLHGLAVDPSGTLWARVANAIYRYSDALNNSFLGEFFTSEGFLTNGPDGPGLAVNSEDDLYAKVKSGEEGVFSEFGPTGELLREKVIHSSAVAADPSTNDFYFITPPDNESQEVVSYSPAGVVLEQFGAGDFGHAETGELGNGIAVNPPDASDEAFRAMYVTNFEQGKLAVFRYLTMPSVTTEKASATSETSVMLTGKVNPGGVPVTQCVFEYGTSASYGHSVPCSSNPGSSSEEVTVSANVTGLTGGSEYHFRLTATNADGEKLGVAYSRGLDEVFLAPTPPVIVSQSALDVASNSATLSAQVRTGGAEAAYVFEYAPAGGTFQALAAEAQGAGVIPGGVAETTVSLHVQGLSPVSPYEFRIVVSNAAGSQTGEPIAFTTQSSGGPFVLPDGRQYEMVSPPDKRGAKIHAISGAFGFDEAAADGDGFAFVSAIPTEAEPVGFADFVQNLSVRGSAGWSSRDLTVPHSTTPGVDEGFGPEYRFFSSDLSHAIVHPFGLFTPCVNVEGASQPCMSPEASTQTTFLSTDFFNGNVEEPCLQASTYCARPLVSGCPEAGEACPRAVEEHADVPPGTFFGGPSGGKEEQGDCSLDNTKFCGPKFAGATPDLSHVLLEAEARLTPEVPSSSVSTPNFLYEWSAGHLTYVGEYNGTYHEYDGVDPISTNGSRVVFDGSYGGLKGLLMRDTASGEAVVIGRPEAQLDAMSSDGSRVFFVEDGELYVFETADGEGTPLTGTVTPLTDDAGFLGAVLGVSEDGSYVYFVSPGAIAGSGASAPGNNLYVDHHEGAGWKPTFIATLSNEDYKDWGAFALGGTSSAGLSVQPTRVSPDGQWLAFMSAASLTGYDNRDAVDGRPDAEVYLYHAVTSNGVAGLTCASCNPTGARPVGVEYEEIGINGALGLEAAEAWGLGSMVAADFPGWQHLSVSYNSEEYQSRYLSDSGRLFFNSEDALVPDDVDGSQDVYEYEPEGVGNCGASSSSGSVVFTPVRDFEASGRSGVQGAGCVGLISSGTASVGSSFLDASQNGGDVFFLTTSKLVPQDADSAYDVYDAHECTVSSPCRPAVVGAPSCETEASCRPAPSPQPPLYGSPPSATFSGPGDLAPPSSPPVAKKVVKRSLKCGKGLVKKHGRCVHKKAGKAKGKAERVGDHGRAK